MNSGIDEAAEDICFNDYLVHWKRRRTNDVQKTIVLNKELKTFIQIKGGLEKIQIVMIYPYDHDHSLIGSDVIKGEELDQMLKGI